TKDGSNDKEMARTSTMGSGKDGAVLSKSKHERVGSIFNKDKHKTAITSNLPNVPASPGESHRSKNKSDPPRGRRLEGGHGVRESRSNSLAMQVEGSPASVQRAGQSLSTDATPMPSPALGHDVALKTPQKELHRGDLTTPIEIPGTSAMVTSTSAPQVSDVSADSNRNAAELKIDGPRHKQVVHPLASASFDDATGNSNRRNARDGSKQIQLHSCNGDVATYAVLFQGAPPYDLTRTIKGITDSRYKLGVALPQGVAKRGGQVTVSVVRFKDGKGYERPLTTSDLVIDVRRIKPTAGFVPSEIALREVIELEDHNVELTIRLSRDGPWKVGV
ncbi:hypothetical protein OC844_007561, partial [Tilletia horrida]